MRNSLLIDRSVYKREGLEDKLFFRRSVEKLKHNIEWLRVVTKKGNKAITRKLVWRRTIFNLKVKPKTWVALLSDR